MRSIIKFLSAIVALATLSEVNQTKAMNADRNSLQSPGTKTMYRRITHAENRGKLAHIDTLIIDQPTKEKQAHCTYALDRLRSIDSILEQKPPIHGNAPQWQLILQHQELKYEYTKTEHQLILKDLQSTIKLQRKLLQDQSKLVETLLKDQEESERKMALQHAQLLRQQQSMCDSNNHGQKELTFATHHLSSHKMVTTPNALHLKPLNQRTHVASVAAVTSRPAVKYNNYQ